MQSSITFALLRFRKRGITIALIIFLLISWFTITTQTGNGKAFFDSKNWEGLNWWAEWLDPILGVSVLLVAISVWWHQSKSNWLKSLEKRLTVHFICEGAEIMRCEEAYLSGDDDIRNWGQQIGRQMIGGKGWLNFEPFLEEKDLKVQYDEVEEKHFYHYALTIYLTKRPDQIGIGEAEMEKYTRTEELTNEKGVLVWRRKRTSNAPPKSTPETAETET